MTACSCSTSLFDKCTSTADYVGPSAACGPPNTSEAGGTCLSAAAAGYVHVTTTLPANLTCSVPDGSPPCAIKGQLTPEQPFTVCCEP